jgi:hypothetical protein
VSVAVTLSSAAAEAQAGAVFAGLVTLLSDSPSLTFYAPAESLLFRAANDSLAFAPPPEPLTYKVAA